MKGCCLIRKAEDEEESDRSPTEADGVLIHQNGACYDTESSIGESEESVPRLEIENSPQPALLEIEPAHEMCVASIDYTPQRH